MELIPVSVVTQNANPTDCLPVNQLSSSKSMVQLLHSFLADYNVVTGESVDEFVMPPDIKPFSKSQGDGVHSTHYLVHRGNDVVSGVTVVMVDSPQLVGAFSEFSDHIRNLAMHPANITGRYGWVVMNVTSKSFMNSRMAVSAEEEIVESRRVFALASVYQFFLACLVIDSKGAEFAYAAITEQFAASLGKLGFAPVKLGANFPSDNQAVNGLTPYVVNLSPFRDDGHPLQGLFNGMRSICGLAIHSF